MNRHGIRVLLSLGRLIAFATGDAVVVGRQGTGMAVVSGRRLMVVAHVTERSGAMAVRDGRADPM